MKYEWVQEGDGSGYFYKEIIPWHKRLNKKDALITIGAILVICFSVWQLAQTFVEYAKDAQYEATH